MLTAWLIGLFSSLHCIGMCGSIALMLPVDRHNKAKQIIQILAYQVGRLTTYSSLGILFGIMGRQFYLAGFQQQLSIVLGILIILIALIPEKVFARYNFSKPIYKVINWVKVSLGSQFKKKTFGSLYTIGLLNGLLPCPMVYVALFGATAMQSWQNGALYMLFFGLGTLPLMTLVPFASHLISSKMRFAIQKTIPYFMVVLGILFLLRGLGLDIAYLSPGTLDLFVQSESDCVTMPK